MRASYKALLSGFLGALASCLGKIALDPESPVHHVSFLSGRTIAEYVVRGFFFVFMLVTNAYMLGAFLGGMEDSGSVAGTALSNASNFVSSATIGYIVWHERHTLIWYTGFAFILVGTLLLTHVGPEKKEKKKKNTKEGEKED